MEGRAAPRLEALLAAAVRVARLGRLGPALGVTAIPTRAATTAGSDQLAGCNEGIVLVPRVDIHHVASKASRNPFRTRLGAGKNCLDAT